MPLSAKDVLIVGQGIAGTMLAWHAEKAGLTMDIYDVGSLSSATAVSSGIINPVTGPKYIKSWMIDDLYPFARKTYQEIESVHDCKILHELPLWRHLPDIRSENLWDSRMSDPNYKGMLSRPAQDHPLHLSFPHKPVFGIVNNALRIDAVKLLTTLREHWTNKGLLIERQFLAEELKHIDGVYIYGRQKYRNVILALGFKGDTDSVFRTLDYSPVKGEVLTCYIEGLSDHQMIKYDKFIVPLGAKKFWVGSNYDRHYKDELPDKSKIQELMDFLENNIGISYRVIDHMAGIRPSTKYRRPFVGQHPDRPHLYLFNGLGTKGISLAPYFSHNLIAAIVKNQVFTPTEAFQKAF